MISCWENRELKYKFLYLKVVGKFSLKFQFISKIIREKRALWFNHWKYFDLEGKLIFVKVAMEEMILVLGPWEVEIHQLLIWIFSYVFLYLWTNSTTVDRMTNIFLVAWSNLRLGSDIRDIHLVKYSCIVVPLCNLYVVCRFSEFMKPLLVWQFYN